MFLSIGLRPFFLLAGTYGCLAMALWLAWIGADVSPFPAAPATASIADVVWHGHEMLFGFAAAVIAGFLLTAVPNWTGAPPLQGAPLAALACLWFAGRLAIWLSGTLPAIAVAIVDLAFLPALGIAVAVPLVRARVFRNIVFLALLAVLFAADLVVHLDLLGWPGANAGTGNLLGLNLVVLLITIVGGRVVPAFTANWLEAEGIKATVHRRPALDALTIAATAAVLVADLAAPADAITGALALVAAALHLVRLAGWQTRRVLGAPIVWILHVGYGWLAIGFALKAVALLSEFIAPATAVHALSVGAVGSMTLGVMSRAALGHTGRALRVATAITAAYVLVSLAAALRIAGPAVLPAMTAETIMAAGISWVFAFGIFTWVYWPVLTRPSLEE